MEGFSTLSAALKQAGVSCSCHNPQKLANLEKLLKIRREVLARHTEQRDRIERERQSIHETLEYDAREIRRLERELKTVQSWP